MNSLLAALILLNGCLAAEFAGYVDERAAGASLAGTCPEVLRVKLSGGPLASQSPCAGRYKVNGQMDGVPFWVKGDMALWFAPTVRGWMIGPLSKLGTKYGSFYVAGTKTDCPNDFKNWQYYDVKAKSWGWAGEDAKIEEDVKIEGEQSYTQVTKSGCFADKYGSYTTLEAAENACTADSKCQGVYHQTCGVLAIFQNTFVLCPKGKTYTQSLGPTGSCVYQKTDLPFILTLG